jgi:hypothetical protein
VETAIIEEAFQQSISDVVLDYYTISFKHLVQVSHCDTSKQRPMKRLINQTEKRLRETISLGGFRRETHELFKLPGFRYTHVGNSLNNAVNRRAMVKQAAKGIIIKGKKVGKELEGKWLAQQLLLSVIDGTAIESLTCMCTSLHYGIISLQKVERVHVARNGRRT